MPTSATPWTKLGDWGDNVTAESTDFVGFRYTKGTNGGKWQAVTRSNGVETAIDTTIAANANMMNLELEVNAAGCSVGFYINGTLRATITTNIPVGMARSFGAIPYFILKSLGTTARTVDCDWTYCYGEIVAGRGATM